MKFRYLLFSAFILSASYLQAQNWEEIFRENFVPNRMDWAEKTLEGREYSIEDGKYVIDHFGDDLAAIVTKEVPMPLSGQYAIETSLENDGSSGYPFGLVFHYDNEENFESFYISTLGSYRYIRWKDGVFEELIPWTETKRMVDGQNTLRVELLSGKTIFSINGHKVDQYESLDPLGTKVGFVVYNKQKIRVDHLSIFTDKNNLVAKAQHAEVGAVSITNDEYENKIALVIGNSKYDSSPLKNPANDAFAVSIQLESLGFEVIRLIDGTRKEMRNSILEFSNQLLQNPGVGIFYYAGHGVQIDGINYLVPVGAEIEKEYEIEDECIRADRVLRMLNSIDNPMNIVILDACRNNPFASSFRSASRGLAMPEAAPKGSIIAFATAPGKTASDGDGNNGLYTQELIKSMQKSGLTIEEVFKDVRINVAEQSNGDQIPWENSSLMGNFYFRKQ